MDDAEPSNWMTFKLDELCTGWLLIFLNYTLEGFNQAEHSTEWLLTYSWTLELDDF